MKNVKGQIIQMKLKIRWATKMRRLKISRGNIESQKMCGLLNLVRILIVGMASMCLKI